MPTGKTILEYTQQTALDKADALLIQRGNSYFYAELQDLLSGVKVEDTYADILTDRNNQDLSIGATYFVTDKYVFLTAIRDDRFALQGHFFARNADHQSAGDYTGITIVNGFIVNATGVNLGIWEGGLAPAAGDVAIYNNLHWLNLLGAVGTAPPGDAVNWEAVPNTDILVANTYGYIYEIDTCDYFFTDDTITSRTDRRRNIVIDDINVAVVNIVNFQWGNDAMSNCFIHTDIPVNLSNFRISAPIRSKVIMDGYSTFEATLSITGLTTIDIVAVSYAGIIFLTSTNATETINIIDNSLTNHPYKFEPETGLIVTFDNTLQAALAADGELLMPADADIDGTKDEFIVFEQVTNSGFNVMRQTDSNTYA